MNRSRGNTCTQDQSSAGVPSILTVTYPSKQRVNLPTHRTTAQRSHTPQPSPPPTFQSACVSQNNIPILPHTQLPTNFPTPPHPATAQYSNPPALLRSPNSSPKFLCQHSDIHPNPPKHPKITVPYPMLFFISTFQPSYTPQNNSLKYVRPVHPDTSWSDISIQTPQTFHTP